MNEIKGYFTAIFIIIFWSAICGFGGYILSNSRAIEQLEQANKQLAEQQQKNEAYNKRFNGNAENEYTSSNENNNYYNNSYVNNTKNVTCKSNNCCNKDTTLLKIIVIIGIVGCILISILIVNSSLILRSINKNK